jgi:nicotinamidase-related amidase
MLTNTKALLAKARKSGVRVMYSKPGPVDWKSVGAPMIRMRMKQMRVSDLNALTIPTAGAATFAQGLEPQSDDIVFEEFLPNAFLGTSFEWWLRKYRLKTLILAGASIETGIDGTARDALNLGYYTVIVRDCVGSPFKDTYDAALKSLERIFDVVDSAEITREW